MPKEDGIKLRGKGALDSQPDKSNTKSRLDVSSKSKQFGFEPMITLLIVSTAMLILPLATYFGIRHYIVNSTTIAAMGAIVMVQIIVAGYIYKAWHDENKEHQAILKEKLKKR